ncbi:uncharacterized protein LOC142537651 [Primulina tabacum]|uniref:uncharacterized protein LOC142537651 n=1 Tax=Primulina tabacum TaxID=48773 RepID=UPI003F593414
MVKELSPAKEKVVLSTYIESHTLRVHRSCGWKFEVVDCDKTCDVDLNEWTCSCRAWQINMLPCKHVCAAIESKSMSVYAFCDKFFKTDMYRQTYKGIINPIPTFDMYEFNGDEGYVINAPDVRSQPRRRKSQRIPSKIQSRLSKCSRCQEKDNSGFNFGRAQEETHPFQRQHWQCSLELIIVFLHTVCVELSGVI